ncbi:uncharacterized protein BdWA1_003738 [Babesia duncani]|uniref:Uncharacterized protein n=1 Tax=Babesia duncani TaxID=323732 RepID=A0AAD9UMK1_9APIC|nr:hypothetical protein BdWA1_003738 [Babesia duncani]
MTGQHEGDFYFQYMFESSSEFTTDDVSLIDSFKFNEVEYYPGCKLKFMSVKAEQVVVYACKVDSNFHPWLLQLLGYYYDSSSTGYRNYFFKFDGNVFKIHKFEKLTVPSGGSIERKQNEDNLEAYSSLNSDQSLKAYISNLKSSGGSAATYYVYKSYYGSSSSEIEPDNLASYLQGESDKQHKYGSESVSQDYEVTSFSSYSGSVPSFEITLKGKVIEQGGSSEESVTYESSSVGSGQLKQTGSSQVFSLPSGGVSLPGSHQHSHVSSSPDIIGIVCGSLIGLGGSIGVGYFAYSHLGGFAEGDTFKPWLLQLVGTANDSGYLNYFFKREDGKNWKNVTFSSLTVPSGRLIQHKQNEPKGPLESKPELNKYISQLKSSASVALGYVYKPSGSFSSEIDPDNLYSYLKGDSDKQHKYVSGSGSEEYSVTSFSSGSYSGSVPSFEITLKGRQTKKSGGSSESDEYILKSVTYVYTSNESGQLKQKGDSHGVSLSGLPSSVPSPGVSVQHSHVSSSPDIIGIVCGSLVGLGGSIGVGLTVPSGSGSIERKQNEDNLDQRLLKAYSSLNSNSELNTYIESLKSSSSAAWYYVYKSSYSRSSEIRPDNLASYLSDSDKQHKNVSESVSQEYSVVTSFSSYSGSVPSFEITLKGKFSGVDELSEKSVTYVYTSNESGQLKQKGDSHGVSLSGLPSSVPSPGVSVQHSHVSSSPDIIGIVCGSLVGLGGSIGVGLTVPSGSGSIERKQNEDNLDQRLLKAYSSLNSNSELNTYIESLKSSSSAAWYYVYKSSYSRSSEIRPDNLASYLSDSDKQHKNVSESVSQEYSVVTSFSSYSGSVPSFEITLKGKFSGVDELSEKSVTYVYTSNESGQLKQKGDSHGVSLSGLPSSVPSPGVSVQHSHVSSSPDIIGIVCGSLVGLGGSIGVGLTVPSGSGSIERKQNEDNLDQRLLKAYSSLNSNSELNTYIESLKSSSSAAWYYVYKSSYSRSSEIRPDNLASYLSDSDKQHKNVSESVSQEYSVVTSFSSYSGSVPSFEITLKGKFSGVDELSEKSVTYVYTSNESGQLKQKGDSHGVSLSGLPSSVPSPGVSVQHSHVSSSPDIIGIVCGSLVGLATLEDLPIDSNNFYPWLLQLVGLESDPSSPGYRNYFFKFVKEDDVFKTHKFSSLTDSNGGSIQPKQNEDNLDRLLKAYPNLKAYFESLKASASAAWYYEFKESSYDSYYSEIEPDNLASYLQGESDKQHKNVSESVSQDYEATSFSSYSGSVPSFEITLKGKFSGVDELSEKSVTYVYESGSAQFGSVQLKQKGSSQVFSLPSGGVSLPGSHQHSQASSSPDIIGIVCGSLIGLGGSIGVGYFAYSHLGGFAGLRSLHGNLRSLGSGFISSVYSHVSNGFSNGFSDKLLSSNLLSHFRSSSHL